MTNTIPEKKPWMTTREKAIQKTFKTKKGPNTDRGCTERICLFTKEENERIANAIKASKLFMQTYGKGREPYLIDKTYYN